MGNVVKFDRNLDDVRRAKPKTGASDLAGLADAAAALADDNARLLAKIGGHNSDSRSTHSVVEGALAEKADQHAAQRDSAERAAQGEAELEALGNTAKAIQAAINPAPSLGVGPGNSHTTNHNE